MASIISPFDLRITPFQGHEHQGDEEFRRVDILATEQSRMLEQSEPNNCSVTWKYDKTNVYYYIFRGGYTPTECVIIPHI